MWRVNELPHNVSVRQNELNFVRSERLTPTAHDYRRLVRSVLPVLLNVQLIDVQDLFHLA